MPDAVVLQLAVDGIRSRQTAHIQSAHGGAESGAETVQAQAGDGRAGTDGTTAAQALAQAGGLPADLGAGCLERGWTVGKVRSCWELAFEHDGIMGRANLGNCMFTVPKEIILQQSVG